MTIRKHSPFLEDLLFHTPKSELDLGGSSPVFPYGPEFFADIQLKTTVPRLIPEFDELREIMGSKLGVSKEQILFTPGSSQGLTQVLATISEPGQTILIEQPNYDPFIYQSKLLGLKTVYFKRTGDEATDAENIAAMASTSKNSNSSPSRTPAQNSAPTQTSANENRPTILLITNPHAPLGGFYSEAFIRKLCTQFDWVIVDEDFFPLFSTDGKLSNLTSNLPENLITLHSFNKAIGLVYLRLGFVRATASLTHKIDLMGNLFHIDVPTPSLQMAHKAALHWDKIVAELQIRLKPMQEKLHAFAKKHPRQLSHDFKSGFFAMLKVPQSLKDGAKIPQSFQDPAKSPQSFKDGAAFSAEFLKQTGIFLRPGKFLGMPESVRFHIFVPNAFQQRFLDKLDEFYSQI